MPAEPRSAFVAAMAMSSQQSSLLVQLAPIVVVIAIFYFIVLLPAKKRRQKVQDFQTSLKVGDKVILTSGIYGQITKLNDERSIQVQIADKTRIDVARAAVGGYQGQDPVVPESGGL
jgi:preprotein translocase subunit YajC